MAWITPKTDWTVADGVIYTDFNRIEENLNLLQTGGKEHVLFTSTGNTILARDGGDVTLGDAADLLLSDTKGIRSEGELLLRRTASTNEIRLGSGVGADSVGIYSGSLLTGKFTSTRNLLIATTSDPGERVHIGSGGMRVTGTSDNVIIDSTGLLAAGAGISVDTIAEKTASTGVSVQASSGEQILTKVIDIGPWNMDTTAIVTIPTGITETYKTLAVSVIVRNDAANPTFYKLETYTAAGVSGAVFSVGSEIGGGSLSLQRTAGGWFDGALFSSTAYSRGRIMIAYEV